MLYGVYALVTSINNNPLEGWGMLLRALAGHGLLIAAVDCGARALHGRPSRGARLGGAMVFSLVLTPLSVLVLLMTKESGPSWSLPAMILVVWFAASGVAAFVASKRRR